MVLLRLNFSKEIVCFFLYQNWLDPSKEIKKQIRGKCTRHTYSHTHSNKSRHAVFKGTDNFYETTFLLFFHSWRLEFQVFCQVLPPRPLCAYRRHHQVHVNNCSRVRRSGQLALSYLAEKGHCSLERVLKHFPIKIKKTRKWFLDVCET